MIALFAAVEEEVRSIRRCLRLRPEHGSVPMRIWRGTSASGEILLSQTGIGRARAEAAVQYALDRYPIQQILSIGFCGALVEDLQQGDIVICSTVLREAILEGSAEPLSVEASRRLLNAATHAVKAVVPRVRAGRCLTVADVVTDSARKRCLGELPDACVVDMESFWVARLAVSHNLPFLSIRAVSDEIHQEIPEVVRRQIGAGGSRMRLVAHVLGHPSCIRPMLSLATGAFAAGRRLSDALVELLAAGIQGEETA